MKKCTLVVAVLLLACLLMLSCERLEKERDNLEEYPKVYIDYNESYFDYFYIDGNNVVFKCVYTINSNEENEVFITIDGNFEEDKKGGLIMENCLEAENIENSSNIFEILPGKNRFEILYTGTRGEKEVKQNRLLPETYIHFLQ